MRRDRPKRSGPMYSLFVSGDVREHSEGVFDIPLARFLEINEWGDRRAVAVALSRSRRFCISSWPCVAYAGGPGVKRTHFD